jgi:hypothetical protein
MHIETPRMFGRRTARLEETVRNSIHDTHEQHAAGQRLMDPRGRRGYGGSIWVKFPNNLCSAVERDFLDASVWRGGRSGYSLPVLDGCVLYVWRTPGGKPESEVSFLTSDIRARLVDGVSAPQKTLFEDDGSETGQRNVLEPEEEEAKDIASKVAKDGLRLILIVVESTPERLHRVKWGEVTRGQDGDMTWLSEDVIHSSDEESMQPARVPERTFADGAPPAAIVSRITEATNDNG